MKPENLTLLDCGELSTGNYDYVSDRRTERKARIVLAVPDDFLAAYIASRCATN